MEFRCRRRSLQQSHQIGTCSGRFRTALFARRRHLPLNIPRRVKLPQSRVENHAIVSTRGSGPGLHAGGHHRVTLRRRNQLRLVFFFVFVFVFVVRKINAAKRLPEPPL
jgi:hypothetical protein